MTRNKQFEHILKVSSHRDKLVIIFSDTREPCLYCITKQLKISNEIKPMTPWFLLEVGVKEKICP